MEREQVIAKNNSKMLYNDEILLKTKKLGHLVARCVPCRHSSQLSLLLGRACERLIVRIEMIEHCLTLSASASSVLGFATGF